MEAKTEASVKGAPVSYRLAQWIQEPMGGVIAASIATMGSLGVVLSGSWLIHLAIN